MSREKKLKRFKPTRPVVRGAAPRPALAAPGVDMSAEAFFRAALTFHDNGEDGKAEELCEMGLSLHPDDASCMTALAMLRQKNGDLAAAADLLARAGDASAAGSEVFLLRNRTLAGLGRHDEALEAYRNGLAAEPDNADLWCGLGAVLRSLARNDEAADAYRRAADLRPNDLAVLAGLGDALKQIPDAADEAVAVFRQAVALRPDVDAGHLVLAQTLADCGRVEESIETLRAAALRPSTDPSVWNLLTQWCRTVWDWSELESDQAELLRLLRTSDQPVDPFVLFTQPSTPADQLENARKMAERTKRGVRPLLGPAGKRAPSGDGRIRIGYLSSDLHTHATAILMAELFERHDRGRLEITAYSWSVDDGSPLRRRLENAFDRFVEIGSMSDREAAQRIRDDGIDILVDLKGYTKGGRLGILALRPAPVQVNYLGFPGTLGADFVDYIITDAIVTPMEHQPFFSEKIVHLPDTYQPNDTNRRIAADLPNRAVCGLPEEGFVFCCFNNIYKLTPEMFDIWARILIAVPGSVLWVLSDQERAEDNLRREAMIRGVDPARIVFANRAAPPLHLARHRLADLFLDTLPVNAHTTASDALWAGLPVLTCPGETFASRVAASLVAAAGLPELAVATLDEYEAMAIRLATEPETLSSLRQRLIGNRLTVPLFDIDRYAYHLEQAYERMWEIHRAGRPPEAFAVEALPIGTSPPERQVPTVPSIEDVSIRTRRAADDQAALLFAEGMRHHQVGRLIEAEDIYRCILAFEPGHFDSLHHLGIVLHQTGRNDEAADILQQALLVKDDHGPAYSNFSLVLRKLGRLDEAVSVGEMATGLAPGDAKAHLNLGFALKDAGRFDEATDAVREAARLNPGLLEARYELVDLLRKQDNVLEALQVLKETMLVQQAVAARQDESVH